MRRLRHTALLAVVLMVLVSACTPTEIQLWRAAHGPGALSTEEANRASARLAPAWNAAEFGGEVRIEGYRWATIDQARRWAGAFGATPGFRDRAELFFNVAARRGIRADIAYALPAKETAFGRHSGVVPETHRNPCGLKVTGGGSNTDPAAHQRLATWAEGVRACVDHLALYAGAPGYPRATTPDPRHFDWLAGTAETVEGLSGAWSPSATYGETLRDAYLGPLLAT